jgi:hypothetical protein
VVAESVRGDGPAAEPQDYSLPCNKQHSFHAGISVIVSECISYLFYNNTLLRTGKRRMLQVVLLGWAVTESLGTAPRYKVAVAAAV